MRLFLTLFRSPWSFKIHFRLPTHPQALPSASSLTCSNPQVSIEHNQTGVLKSFCCKSERPQPTRLSKYYCIATPLCLRWRISESEVVRLINCRTRTPGRFLLQSKQATRAVPIFSPHSRYTKLNVIRRVMMRVATSKLPAACANSTGRLAFTLLQFPSMHSLLFLDGFVILRSSFGSFQPCGGCNRLPQSNQALMA